MVSICRMLVVSLFLSSLHPQWVIASGFTVYDFGAEEQAQGNAVAAQVDTPSAVFYNPAAISDLEGTQLKVGTSVLVPKITFQSNLTNQDTETKPGPFYPSYFFMTQKMSQPLTIGFGFFSAIGNEIDYPSNWEGRFFLTSSDLKQFNFAPTAAYQLSENLSIGVSAVVTYATLKQSSQLDLSALLGPSVEGTTSTDLDGFGIGGVISAKATAKKWTLGLVYKSPTRIEFKGDAEFQVPDPVRPLFPNGNARTTQEFPQMVILGIANEPLDGLTVELDLQWINWDSFDQQTVKFDKQTAAVQNITTTLNWEDTWTLRMGGNYNINDATVVRLGYVYDPSAVPSETLSPLIPELDKHIIETGLGYAHRKWNIDLYFGYIFGDSRQVNNSLLGMPAHSGKYKISAYGGGFSLQFIF